MNYSQKRLYKIHLIHTISNSCSEIHLLNILFVNNTSSISEQLLINAYEVDLGTTYLKIINRRSTLYILIIVPR